MQPRYKVLVTSASLLLFICIYVFGNQPSVKENPNTQPAAACQSGQTTCPGNTNTVNDELMVENLSRQFISFPLVN
ncbi:MAG: hypothetical protein J0M10_09275 [Chitinophagales bacterium]|nr:hypothetical protein [Chitinophagales bacterium]